MENSTEKTNNELKLSEGFFDNEILSNRVLSIIKAFILFGLLFFSHFVVNGQPQNSASNDLLIENIRESANSIEFKVDQNILNNPNTQEDVRNIFSEIKTLTALVKILSKLNSNDTVNKEINSSNEISNKLVPIATNLEKINKSLDLLISNQDSRSLKIKDNEEVIIALKNINEQLKELNKNVKKEKTVHSKTDYLKIIQWVCFYIVLFFVLLYVSRLLRYYIKLTQHFKDRKLAFKLKEELDITHEEAIMIVSSAYIDFKTPKIATDLLTQYYVGKNKSNCCCCCCCRKCNCDENNETR